MPTACPWEPHVCRYTRRHPLPFLSAGQRRLCRRPAGRGYDCLADLAASVTIPRASRGHLGAGRAGAGVANVGPRNERPGTQRPRSGPARVVSFPCPSVPCPSVRIGRLPIITALPKHGVPPSLCLPGCVQAAQHHAVALEKSRTSPFSAPLFRLLCSSGPVRKRTPTDHHGRRGRARTLESRPNPGRLVWQPRLQPRRGCPAAGTRPSPRSVLRSLWASGVPGRSRRVNGAVQGGPPPASLPSAGERHAALLLSPLRHTRVRRRISPSPGAWYHPENLRSAECL